MQSILREMMSDLDMNSEKIPEGFYLKTCDNMEQILSHTSTVYREMARQAFLKYPRPRGRWDGILDVVRRNMCLPTRYPKNPPDMESIIREMMSDLYMNSDKIPEGFYIKMCDNLKQIYTRSSVIINIVMGLEL